MTVEEKTCQLPEKLFTDMESYSERHLLTAEMEKPASGKDGNGQYRRKHLRTERMETHLASTSLPPTMPKRRHEQGCWCFLREEPAWASCRPD